MRFPVLRGVALGLLILAAPVRGLDPTRTVEEYSFQAWSSREGLPQSTVNVVAQSRDGYLWVGTRIGLVRFDGVRFTLLDSGGSVESLAIDPAGTVWAGFSDGRLDVWKKGSLGKVRERRPGDTVQSMLQDSRGTLWVGTSQGLERRRDGHTEAVPLPGCSTDCLVTALAQGRDGSLWIGTSDRGVIHLGAGEPAVLRARDGLPDDGVRALTVAADGTLWVGTQRGLGCLRAGHWTAFTQADGLPSTVVYALFEDRDGNLWVGTRRGLSRFRQGRFESLPRGDALSSFGVRSLFEDAEGSLWVGTHTGGLRRLRDAAFTTVTLGGELEDIWSIYQDRDGDQWFGTGDRGLLRRHGDKITALTTLDGLPHDRVRAILQDRDGALWVGTAGGLARLRGGHFQVWRRGDGLPADYIRVIYEDRDETLWIGTDGGLAHGTGERFTVSGPGEGLPRDRVFAVLRDRRGALWVGMQSGLFRSTAAGRFELVQGGASVLTLLEDREGTLWIGTDRGGLLRFRDGRLTRFLQNDGLFNDVLEAMAEDARGRLWIGCNLGIFRVLKSDLDDFSRGKIPTIPTASFSDTDGMKSAECNGGNQPSTLVTPDGRLWFPTYQGVAVTDPERVPVNRRPPPVVIEGVLADGVAVPFTAGRVRLKPGTEKIEVRYTALSLLAPEKVRSLYRLEGFDRHWVDAGRQRSAVYTSLPPGQYTFRVTAGNNDGLWNTAGARLELDLPPQVWATGWFLTLCAGLVLGVAVGAVRLRLRATRRQQQELARLVTERTRELQEEKARAVEASRAKGEFLAHMSHEIRTPLNAVLGMTSVLLGAPLPAEEHEQVETIRRSGEALLTVINDILDVSKIEAGALDVEIVPFRLRDCLDEALAIVQPKAAAQGLSLDCHVGAGVPVAVESDPARLRQILVNLLDNAVKFTRRGGVRLEVAAGAPQEEGLELRLAVRDTGIGIPADRLCRLFQPFSQADSSTTRVYGGTGLGLAISRYLAERLGGTMWVESEPGRGSTFTFTLRCREAELPAGRPASALADDLAGPLLAESLPLRILVAEDNSINQKVALLMLERLGYRADVAGDGFEVLAALERQRYNVVLMDIQMPEMDGLEATRRIRSSLPAERQPRVIAMTANVLQQYRDACLEAGMDDFLGKPVLFADLRAALERCGGGVLAVAPEIPAEPLPEVFDSAQLDSLRKLGEATGKPVVRDVVDSYLDETPRRLQKMRQAMDRGDAEGFTLLAHSLKGSSAQLGAVRVAAVSAALEQQGRSSTLEGAAGLLGDLERELARVVPLLEGER
jgi:signal transduction histidine kinase/ligand-binding sensor domain-containing protein/DNA-binding NarL/FixJ family response regulator